MTPRESAPPESRTGDFERALPLLETERYDLRLYVAGPSARSQAAIENVRRVCAEFLRGRCTLEVIDIYQDQHTFREDQIVAVPALIRRAPLPSRRLIGDLSERSKVLAGLELVPKG